MQIIFGGLFKTTEYLTTTLSGNLCCSSGNPPPPSLLLAGCSCSPLRKDFCKRLFTSRGFSVSKDIKRTLSEDDKRSCRQKAAMFMYGFYKAMLIIVETTFSAFMRKNHVFFFKFETPLGID